MHAVHNLISAIIDDLWSPFKHLSHQIQTFLVSNTQDVNLPSFEALLRKNKQHFISLLTNPVSCLPVMIQTNKYSLNMSNFSQKTMEVERKLCKE